MNSQEVKLLMDLLNSARVYREFMPLGDTFVAGKYAAMNQAAKDLHEKITACATIDANEGRPLLERLREAFDKQEGAECATCGWSPCFYEIEDDLELESPGVYRASCVNKDDENSWDHKGHYISIESET